MKENKKKNRLHTMPFYFILLPYNSPPIVFKLPLKHSRFFRKFKLFRFQKRVFTFYLNIMIGKNTFE